MALDQEFDIELTETPSILVFEKPSFIDCFESKEKHKQGNNNQATERSNRYVQFKEERACSDMFCGRGSQTFQPRHIERSTLTEEPEMIEAAIDAFDFEIKEEMKKVTQSKLEQLENSFKNQIKSELDNHQKSPFFFVPNDLTAIRFFDITEPLPKWSKNKIELRNTMRKTMKEMQVSIHNSSFKLSHSKKLSEGGIRRMNKSRLTFNGNHTNSENIYRGNYGSGNGQNNGTLSEVLDHVDSEMKKFEMDLAGSKMNLVISEEEYKVI